MPSTEPVLEQDVHLLYARHHAWLRAWLRHKLGCSHNAADVAHDTFLRIVASRDALLGIQEPRAYLTTVAKRLLVDRARRRVLEDAYLAELAVLAETLGSYPSPEEIALAVEALDQIGAALARVSAPARAAFLLHYLDGQTHAAIAVQLEVSTRMVQKYLVQALLQCHAGCPALAPGAA